MYAVTDTNEGHMLPLVKMADLIYAVILPLINRIFAVFFFVFYFASLKENWIAVL